MPKSIDPWRRRYTPPPKDPRIRVLGDSLADMIRRRREGLSCALCSTAFDMPPAKPGRRLCVRCGRTAK